MANMEDGQTGAPPGFQECAPMAIHCGVPARRPCRNVEAFMHIDRNQGSSVKIRNHFSLVKKSDVTKPHVRAAASPFTMSPPPRRSETGCSFLTADRKSKRLKSS